MEPANDKKYLSQTELFLIIDARNAINAMQLDSLKTAFLLLGLTKRVESNREEILKYLRPGLIKAIQYSWYHGTEIILRHGTDLARLSDVVDGTTPLHIAVSQSKYPICDLLLAYGADHQKADGKGITAMKSAQLLNRQNLVEAMEKFETGFPTEIEFHKFLAKKRLVIPQLKYRTGGIKWANTPFGSRYFPIHHVAMAGNDDALMELLRCKIDLEQKTYGGMTAVEIAIDCNNLSTAQILHAQGADIKGILRNTADYSMHKEMHAWLTQEQLNLEAKKNLMRLELKESSRMKEQREFLYDMF